MEDKDYAYTIRRRDGTFRSKTHRSDFTEDYGKINWWSSEKGAIDAERELRLKVSSYNKEKRGYMKKYDLPGKYEILKCKVHIDIVDKIEPKFLKGDDEWK